MEFKELKELIDLFSKSSIDELDLQQEKISLKLAKKKETLVAAPMVAAAAPAPVGGAVSSTGEPAKAPSASEDEGLLYVKSPIVGTFYRAPNPTSEPFTKIGTKVHQGMTLCIVEAMKLMNEIQSDVDGEVVKILVENGQGVEFGQKLFAVKPH